MAYDLPEGAQGLTPKSLIEDLQAATPNSIDPKTMFGLVQAALDPDERKFFKLRLGTDSYEMTDFFNPSGRFDRARKDRESVQNFIMKQGLSLMDPALPTQEEVGQYGVPLSPYSGSQLPPRTFDITELQPRLNQTFSNPDQRQDSLGIGPPDMGPFPRTITVPGGPNPQARIRPAQLAVFNAITQGMGRGRQPQQIPAGLQEFNAVVGSELAAREEELGRPLTAREKADSYALAAGRFQASARPGSSEAKTAKVVGDSAQEKVDAEIKLMRAKATLDTNEAMSITKQLEGRLTERAAQIKLLGVQASMPAQKLELAEQKSQLDQAAKLFVALKLGLKEGSLTTVNENLLTKTIMELILPGMTATPKPAAFIPSLFGATESPGVDLAPNPNGKPRVRSPERSATPSDLTPPPIDLTNRADEALKKLKKLQQDNPGYDVKILPDGTQLKRKKS